MTWLDFFVLTLAGGGIVDVWFNGSLFEGWRNLVEVKAADPDAGVPPPAPLVAPDLLEEPLPLPQSLFDRWVPRFVARLLDCPYCLSYHATFWPGLLFWAAGRFLPTPWDAVLALPLYSLAATRLGNLLNAFLPRSLSYARSREAAEAGEAPSPDDELAADAARPPGA